MPTRLDRDRAQQAPVENREIDERALAFSITPARAHFVRNHFGVPRTVEDALAIGGAVADPASVSLAELARLEQRTVVVTLECAGNGRSEMTPLPPGEPWRHGAVSTAAWSGVPLHILLARAGLRDDVVEILAGSADGFERSIPVEKALDRDVLIATEMNGEPIPFEHGGPLRLVVPGWYGMASVKWLSSLRALTTPFDGPYQVAHYVYDDGPVTVVRPRALIVSPKDGARVHRLELWGWAWSSSPIVAVEISIDAEPWRHASLERSSLPHAWVRWQSHLSIDNPGRHSLRARARDANGNLQPDQPVHNRLGYGNNAVQLVIFEIL